MREPGYYVGLKDKALSLLTRYGEVGVVTVDGRAAKMGLSYDNAKLRISLFSDVEASGQDRSRKHSLIVEAYRPERKIVLVADFQDRQHGVHVTKYESGPWELMRPFSGRNANA